MPVLVHVKIFTDATAATTGDNARRFVVTDDLGGTRLRSAHFTVTSESTSGTLQLQVANLTAGTLDLLSTPTRIDAGETSSYTASTLHVVATADAVFNGGTFPTNYMTRGDVLRFDVDAAGTAAKGLEALLEFGPPILKLS
jgi:hypothetical protein